MPRAGQAPTAVPNQGYGQAGQQIEAQRAVPLPRVPNPSQVQGGRPAGGGQQPAPQQEQAPQDPMQAAIQYARDFDPGITPLTAPSTRPGEPVQEGLSLGPGAGPDIFSQPARANQAADFLTALAQASGDQSFLDKASKIRGSGGFM